MLYDDIEDPDATSPTDLRSEYEAELASIVETRGVETVVDETGVDEETVTALAEGDVPDVTLADAAAIAALADDAPDADAILAEVRDTLLMGMTTAVMDVDTLAAELDADMGAKRLQQKIEGRAPMTLAEYATVHHAIASQDAF